MSEARPLAGKVAWVTGSSRGLGRVMATRLCGLGARVVSSADLNATVVIGTRPACRDEAGR